VKAGGMRVDVQRRVDRIAGTAICRFLSVFARRDETVEDPAPKNVLVILLSEMGSLLLARPMFDRLRADHPGARLHVLVFRQNREFVDVLGLVPPEDVLTIRNDSFFHLAKDSLAAVSAMRARKIDAVLDCELFARVSSILSYLSGARLRVGFHRHTQEGLYRGDFLNRRVLYNPYVHVAHQFVNLAAAIPAVGRPLVKRDVAADPPRVEPMAFPPEEVEQIARRLESDFPAVRGRRLVLVSPSGGILPIRAWPIAHYAELVEGLLADGHAVGVVGLPRDRPVAVTLKDRVRSDRLVDLTGWTGTVRELLLLFHRAALLVANDGGPGHFAALTPMPAVVLYGPETPALYGTLAPASVNLFAGLSCSPCLTAYNHRNSPCDGDNQCLKRIRPDAVLARCRQALDPQALQRR
jgi:ADP-heptose:LPS heptosyltransferase